MAPTAEHAGMAGVAEAPATPLVLVVEDNPVIQELVARALEDEGYRTLAATGSASLVVAHDHQPDVILLDLVMPDLDGIAVSAALKADPVTAHIPIVAMSTVLNLAQAGTRMHADAVLAKPFALDDLYEVVARWCPRR